jgi:hypothetical protein
MEEKKTKQKEKNANHKPMFFHKFANTKKTQSTKKMKNDK